MGKGGDQLARGAHSATFETPQVSQEVWNDAFGGGETTFEERLKRKREQEALEKGEEPKEQEKIVEVRKQVEEKRKYVPGQSVPFRAVQDRVVVARIDEEEKVNDLFIPDEAKEKPQEGIVVAVGPGRVVDGALQPVSVVPGERVLFGKYSGQEIKIDFQMFLVLREEDIFIVKQ